MTSPLTARRDALEPIVRAHIAYSEGATHAFPEGRSVLRPDGTALLVMGVPLASMNGVITPALEPDPAVIAALAADAEWGGPWSIQVRGEADPRIAALAAEHGLTDKSQEPLLVRRYEQEGLPDPMPGLHCRAATKETIKDFMSAVAAGFEAPRNLFEAFDVSTALELPGVTYYFAEVDGVMVGTGQTLITADLVGLYNITIASRYRRSGYGRALTAELLRRGQAAGATTAFLYSSKMGRPVYEAIGFRLAEQMTVFTRP